MTTWLTVGEVLENPQVVPEDHWLLLPRERPWTVTTPCRIDNLDELAADVDLPTDAADAGFTCDLDGATVHDIFTNLEQQAADPDTDLRRRALEHYAEYDAFIVLDDGA